MLQASISGELELRKYIVKSNVKYEVLLGKVPFEEHLSPLFDGGEFVQLNFKRNDGRKYLLQGRLNIYKHVISDSFFKNGWKIRETSKAINVFYLGKQPLMVRIGDLFRIDDFDEWNGQGYWNINIDKVFE